MTRRSQIPQRRRIFFGCEGESERGYAARLQQVSDELKLSLHIDAHPLQPGAGDPAALIARALQVIKKHETSRGVYFVKALFLDADTQEKSPDALRQALQHAEKTTLAVIWQKPCYEAFLLRHLENCERLQPVTSRLAHDHIKKYWPNYKKPMSAQDLSPRIDAAAIRRAAQVEEQLAAFLKAVGFA